MNNRVKFLAIGACAFIVGMSVNNFAMSEGTSTFKVGVVDVQKVVSNSKQVNALKAEQKKQIEGLTDFVKKAREAVAKEADPKKKEALEASYNKELNIKKEKIDKEYAQKLTEIDKNITAVIADKANKDKYDLILSKGIVLSGGVDITDAISASVK